MNALDPHPNPKRPWKWNTIAAIIKVLVSTLLATFVVTRLPVRWVQNHPLSVVVLPFLFIARELWVRLKPRWLDALAEAIDSFVRDAVIRSISHDQKNYLRYVADQCRPFDVKGFSTQGTYALWLDKVFVQLQVSPDLTTAPGPVPSPSEKPGKGRDIWQYLSAGSHVGNFLIIGRPGSGKTTLLRHIALMLAQRGRVRSGRIPRKLPILLLLRNHAGEIQNAPDLSLTDVVGKSTWLREMAEPIPIRWFEHQLQRGRFLILFDGLDEVADPDTRELVQAWLERQMQIYSRNSFIVTSRPRAFVDRIAGMNRLIIQPFNMEQVRQFVENWYMANVLAGLDRNSYAARECATRDARDLLERISSSEVLKELAVNPLLLTMIATIHRYRGKLPERRVEFYREIWGVLLSRRDCISHQPGLTPDHKRCVLEPLAHFMMQERTQEVDPAQAHQILKEGLKRVSREANVERFLAMIEETSGLLLKKENRKYEFAHKTFQEYLSAVYCSKMGIDLASCVGDDWWLGTIRLYIAQSDGTLIGTACLRKIHDGEATPRIVELARACLKEALQLDPQIRGDLESAVASSAPPQEPEQPAYEVPSRPTKLPYRRQKAVLTAIAASSAMALILLLTTLKFNWGTGKAAASSKGVHRVDPAPTPLTSMRKVNYVLLMSGDIATMVEMKKAFTKSIEAAHIPLGDTAYERAPENRDDRWQKALEGAAEQLKLFPLTDANYVIAIGTQACQRAKAKFGPMLNAYRLICIGVTAPIGSGVISKANNRNREDQNIGAVAYLQTPRSYVLAIEKIIPGFTIHYVYQSGIPQNDAMAAGLSNLPNVVVTRLNHEPTDADFPANRGEAYFSWFPFEHIKIARALRDRILITILPGDVKKEGGTAIAISPDSAELGQKGADMLILDFEGKQPLAIADMRYPDRLHYSINCKNAQRLGLKLSKEVMAGADQRFQCD